MTHPTKTFKAPTQFIFLYMWTYISNFLSTQKSTLSSTKTNHCNLWNMKHQVQKKFVGVPISSAAYSSKSSSGNLITDHNLAIKCYNPPSKANAKFNHSKYSLPLSLDLFCSHYLVPNYGSRSYRNFSLIFISWTCR